MNQAVQGQAAPGAGQFLLRIAIKRGCSHTLVVHSPDLQPVVHQALVQLLGLLVAQVARGVGPCHRLYQDLVRRMDNYMEGGMYLIDWSNYSIIYPRHMGAGECFTQFCHLAIP